jgi:hypothetical protein
MCFLQANDQISHLDQLLDTVFATFKAATSASSTDASEWVMEANKIFLVSSMVDQHGQETRTEQ